MSCEDGENCPVSDKLCMARMNAVIERINGMKTAIYSTGTTIIIIVTVAEVLLKLWKG